MREIVLDTETTGMDPEKGDRLVEIGCVELEGHIATGRTFQVYINPERDIPAEATAVHGITNEFVKDKPVFAQVYSEFLDFIGDARLVIHNAEFDMKFINYQLKDVGAQPIPWSRVTDTLALARQKFPGSPANLDALCRRFGVDNTGRTYHGALLDSQLLAEVYLELLGGRQQGLSLLTGGSASQGAGGAVKKERTVREARVFAIPEDEAAAHQAMLEKIKEPLWLKA